MGLTRLSHARDDYSGAAPSDIRQRNRTAVLRAIYPNVWCSRAELSRITGMSKVSTSDVVAELIHDGLVTEGGYQNSPKPGKPALLVGFNAQSMNVVSVDISEADGMRGIVTDLAGNILERDQEAIVEHMPLRTTQVVEFCERLVESAHAPVLGVAVATPGTVDEREGVVLAAPNLGWSDVELAAILRDRLGLEATVANDADCALFAERCFAQGSENMMLVQVAKGLGAALLIGGNVVQGADHAAGEIGHVVVDDDGPQCVCGKRGCLETLVSTPVLEHRIAQDPDQRGDIVADAGAILGRALAMPVAMSNISEVVVAGPEDVVDDEMVRAARDVINDMVRSRFITAVNVRRSRLGVDAAALGAVAFVMRDQLRIL